MHYVISPYNGNTVEVKDDSPLIGQWQSAPAPQSSPASVPAGQSNVTQQGTGYSGTLSADDMKIFMGMQDANAQMAYLKQLANQNTAMSPASSLVGVPGSVPAAGGFTYGTDPEKDRAYDAQKKIWDSDPVEKQKEIDRALAVYRGQVARGEDTLETLNHLTKTLGVDRSLISESIPTGAQGSTIPTGSIPIGSIPAGNVPSSSIPNNSTPTQPATNQTAQYYIEQAAQARKDKAIADLESARDAALSSLNLEKSTIAPQYTQARNQASAGAQQAARNFAEFMAARGGTNTGVNAQAELSRGAALQDTMGSLDRQEVAANQDIARRTTDVNTGFATNLSSAMANIDADKMNALLQDYYNAQQRGDTLAQQAIENEFRRAGLTGVLNGEQTLAGQQQAYEQDPNNPANVAMNLQNQLAKLQLDNYPEQAKAQAKLLEQQLKAGEISNAIAALNLKELQDPNSVTNRAASLDLQLKQLEAKNLPEQQKLQLEQLRKTIDQIGKAPYQSETEIQLDKVKLQTAQEQLKQLQNPPATTTPTMDLSAAQKTINSSPFVITDPDTGAVSVPNPQGLGEFIFYLDLPESLTRQLYALYGLKWGQ